MSRSLFQYCIAVSCWLFISACSLPSFIYTISRTDGKPEDIIKISLTASHQYVQRYNSVRIVSTIYNCTKDTISITDNVLNFESPGLKQTSKSTSFYHYDGSSFYQKECKIIPGDSIEVRSDFNAQSVAETTKGFLKYIRGKEFKVSVSGIKIKDKTLPPQQYTLTAPASFKGIK